ncbi:hypothetical protein GQ457_03G038930 [Hibiscus cannabinus]
MADARRSDHVFPSEVGIHSGLNRIKIPRVLLKEQPSSKPGELNELRTSKPFLKLKQKSVAHAQGKISGFYNEELFGSLHSRFDAAKETIDTELATFAADVMDVLQTIDSSSPEGPKMAEDLLYLAQQCVEMTSSDFVLNCQTVLVKWLCTRMLFILTRCTRLQGFCSFRKREPIDENSINKFKKCLESIPAVEMSWSLASDIADSDSAIAMYQRVDGEQKLQGQSEVSLFPKPAGQKGITSGKDSRDSVKIFCCGSLHEHNHSFDGSLMEPERTLNGFDSVIYKSALNCIDVDEHLVKLAEILELIIESRNLNSIGSLDNSRMQNLSSAVTSEVYSPKIRSPGNEAWQLWTILQEDVTLILSGWNMVDLSDIARCVAGTDLSKEGSHKFLLACMHATLARYLQRLVQSSMVSTPLNISHKERTTIDDFEIIKPISRGAFGKFFLASKKDNRRPICHKVKIFDERRLKAQKIVN